MALLPEDSNQQAALVAIIAIVGGAYAFWTYWYTPTQEEITRMEERVERLETQNRRARVMATQGREELEERLAVYERHVEQLEELIPQSDEVPELLDAMALEARQTGIDLALMQPEPAQPGEFYTRRTYSMGVIGPYQDVGRFLAAIASLSRIIRPIDLELAPGPAREDDAGESVLTVQANFRIQTYVLPEARTQSAPAGGGQQSAGA